MRLPRERFDYSPIVTRRPWKLPKKARIAVWTIVNIEEWDIEKPIIRQYLTAPQGVLTVISASIPVFTVSTRTVVTSERRVG